jgi:hypothetical protein
MLIYLFVAATQIAWLGSVDAVLGGYLIALVAVDVVAAVGCGYALAGIATARSRSAFGHGRAAALAFIPLANFVLLFAKPKADSEHAGSGAIPVLSGGLGVLSGLFLLLGTIALSSYVTTETMRRGEAAAASDPSFQVKSLEMSIASLGLAESLKQIAYGYPVPETVDDVTTLVRVEADGDVLRYVYELTEVSSIPLSLRVAVTNSNCRLPFFEPIFKADGGIQHLYLGQDGAEIGRIDVTRKACGL